MTDKNNTGNESVAVGGRPGIGAMYENLTSWGGPLEDEYTRQSTPVARNPRPVTAAEPGLPLVRQARELLGKEIKRLRGVADGLERSINAQPALGAFQGTHYGDDMRRAHQAMTDGYRRQLAAVEDELLKLESLDGHGAREWARDYMASHRGSVRG